MPPGSPALCSDLAPTEAVPSRDPMFPFNGHAAIRMSEVESHRLKDEFRPVVLALPSPPVVKKDILKEVCERFRIKHRKVICWPSARGPAYRSRDQVLRSTNQPFNLTFLTVM